MTLRELRQRRAAALAELRSLNEAAERETRDLSDNERTRFDALKKEIEDIDSRITRAVAVEDMERRAAAAATLNDAGGDEFDQECRRYSLVRAIASQVPDIATRVDAGREREVAAELARRAGRPLRGIVAPASVFQVERRVITSTSTPGAGAGGALIPTDHRSDLYIDALRARLITAQRGARVINDLVGNVDIPRLKATGTAGWIAENAPLTPADPEFNKVQLTPKHVGALTEFSRNMLLQSSPDIEQLVRADFAAIMAAAVDRAAIFGGGANEPDGIMQNAITWLTLGVPTWAGVLAFIEAIEIDNADEGALGWATTPQAVRRLRSTLKVPMDAGAGYIMEGPRELAGYPLSSSTVVPSDMEVGSPTGGLGSPPVAIGNALIFGNWSDLLIGYWGAVEILVNPYEATAYAKGNVMVRGLLTGDVAVRHPESFAAAQDVLPVGIGS